jgi:hypothetical protein
MFLSVLLAELWLGQGQDVDLPPTPPDRRRSCSALAATTLSCQRIISAARVSCSLPRSMRAALAPSSSNTRSCCRCKMAADPTLRFALEVRVVAWLCPLRQTPPPRFMSSPPHLLLVRLPPSSSLVGGVGPSVSSQLKAVTGKLSSTAHVTELLGFMVAVAVKVKQPVGGGGQTVSLRLKEFAEKPSSMVRTTES